MTPVATNVANSPAFQSAAVRSEVRRTIAVIGVVILIVGFGVTRGLWRELHPRVQVVALVGMLLLLAIQFATLLLARRAQRQNKPIPDAFILATVIVESLLPTGILLAHVIPQSLPPYAALSSPPVLMYGLLACLTTLRLRPGLCVLAGVLGAIGYWATLFYVTYGLQIVTPTTGLPRAAYLMTGVVIFASGLAGAWVALEIRKHVEAALNEAETRRQMDRIAADLAVAQSIQQALLPRSAPNIPGYDIAGWNRPADQTGGDYYDWQQLPDGNWIITLADVCGHGIGPSLVTAACRAYIRASSAHHDDLESLTARINRLLADDLPDGRFVTMASVLIRPAGGPIALLSAGHGPIVLYAHQSGAVEDIMPHDLPLAIDPQSSFGPASTVTLSAGDVLALVTDGFVEWARKDAQGNRVEYGTERLRDSLREHAHLKASEIIRAITDDVSAFAQGTPQQDDLTIVIIKRA